MKKLFLAIIIGLASSACGHFKLGNQLKKKQFEVKNTWTRPTLSTNSLEHRLSHRMMPIFTQDKVIQGNGNDSISAFSRSNGKLLWRLPIEHGVEGGAQVFDGQVYFGGNDGLFYSVTLAEGKENWQVPVNAQVLGAPLVHDKRVYFLNGSNTVFALSTSGEQLWIYRRATGSMLSVRGASRPAIYDNILYVGMSDGYFVALDINDGKLIWERQLVKNVRFTDVDSSPQIIGERVFISSYDGTLFCLSRKDGQILWRLEKGSHAAATVFKDQVFYATSEGELLSLKVETGEVLWTYKVPEGVATQPQYYKGLVVFGESEGPLRFLSSSDGKPIAAFDTGRGISAPPGVSAETGEIFVMSNEGLLYALQAGWFEQNNKWPWM